jgi:hypothetical protein
MSATQAYPFAIDADEITDCHLGIVERRFNRQFKVDLAKISSSKTY